MLHRLFGHMRQNVVAYVALFVSLGGTSAYAANTISTSDIIDNQVTSADVRDDNLGFGGLAAQDLSAGSVGSSEIANLSIQNSDIADNAVESAVVQNNSLQGSDIQDNSLKDEDVGQGTFVNFLASIGSVPANSCVDRPLTGINAQGDHLLLAANWDGSSSQLSYGVEYRTSNSDAFIKVCNPTNAAIDDSFTRFNLLVINAN